MPIVSFKNLLEKANKNSYAVGAFNISDLDTARAVIRGAEAENSPVIIQIWEGIFNYINADELVPYVRAEIEKSSVPVALHLDHAESFDKIANVIGTGFNSVMIDVSREALEENIRISSEVVNMAHNKGIEVEAELGHIGTGDRSPETSREELLTDPVKAVEFVDKTNIDSLAVAIGTAHGVYSYEPKLDFNRLKKINENISIPLVLHGGSNTPEEGIKKSIELGISKINVATDLNIAYFNKLKFDLNSPDFSPHFPLVVSEPARKEITRVVREKIRLFGSKDKA